MGRRRSDLVSRYRESGLTQKEFCRREGVGLSTLHYQLNHLQKPAEDSAGFVPVGRPMMFEIEATNGVKIRVPVTADVSLLAKILEVAGARA